MDKRSSLFISSLGDREKKFLTFKSADYWPIFVHPLPRRIN